jgi:hypothetical protein
MEESNQEPKSLEWLTQLDSTFASLVHYIGDFTKDEILELFPDPKSFMSVRLSRIN